jgi:hypothetical protein
MVRKMSIRSPGRCPGRTVTQENGAASQGPEGGTARARPANRQAPVDRFPEPTLTPSLEAVILRSQQHVVSSVLHLLGSVYIVLPEICQYTYILKVRSIEVPVRVPKRRQWCWSPGRDNFMLQPSPTSASAPLHPGCCRRCPCSQAFLERGHSPIQRIPSLIQFQGIYSTNKMRQDCLSVQAAASA